MKRILGKTERRFWGGPLLAGLEASSPGCQCKYLIHHIIQKKKIHEIMVFGTGPSKMSGSVTFSYTKLFSREKTLQLSKHPKI